MVTSLKNGKICYMTKTEHLFFLFIENLGQLYIMASTKSVGNRLQVWRGECMVTTGGLTKKDLMKHPKTGKIISIRLSQHAQKIKPLGGYLVSKLDQ